MSQIVRYKKAVNHTTRTIVQHTFNFDISQLCLCTLKLIK